MMKQVILLGLILGQVGGIGALSQRHYAALYQSYQTDFAMAQKAHGDKKISLLQDAKLALNVLTAYTKQVHGDYAAVTQVLQHNGAQVSHFAIDSSALQADLTNLEAQIKLQKAQLEQDRKNESAAASLAIQSQAAALKAARKLREARVDAVASAVTNRRDRIQVAAAEARDTAAAMAEANRQATLNSIVAEPAAASSPAQVGRQYDQKLLALQRDLGHAKLARSLDAWKDSAI